MRAIYMYTFDRCQETPKTGAFWGRFSGLALGLPYSPFRVLVGTRGGGPMVERIQAEP
jgi:hypothetical protein